MCYNNHEFCTIISLNYIFLRKYSSSGKKVMSKKDFILDFNTNTDLNSIETLSDLEQKEFQGKSLNKEEAEALRLFRKIRLKKLKNKTDKEEQFHCRFEYFRAVFNLVDYREFLKNNHPRFSI